jgi:hypothetical protein
VIREGGIFDIVPDESGDIAALHIQKKSWRDYTLQFSPDGPKMCDGSHKYSQYNFQAMPWTGIDGLGKSFIAGITCNLTENSACILKGERKFFRDEDKLACECLTLILIETVHLFSYHS